MCLTCSAQLRDSFLFCALKVSTWLCDGLRQFSSVFLIEIQAHGLFNQLLSRHLFELVELSTVDHLLFEEGGFAGRIGRLVMQTCGNRVVARVEFGGYPHRVFEGGHLATQVESVRVESLLSR